MSSINIAIFASGSGSNAENITQYLLSPQNKGAGIEVSLILSNKADAYVLERAHRLGVKSAVFSKREMEESSVVDTILAERRIDFIILAGFLLKFPERLVGRYQNRIINIHPALLPKYGGKGMYGERVHQAVIAAKERESGITIHLVNEVYDNGPHLFQAKCNITEEDTPETLAAKIHQLEAQHFPSVVFDYIRSFG